MKKQRRQMIFLLVLLVALVGGFFGLKQYNKVQSEQPEEEEGIIVVDMNRDDIIKFSYDYEGVTYEFVKEDDTWYYAADKALNIDQSSVSLKTMKMCPLNAEHMIENVTDMTQYGLDEPSKTLQFETATESVILYVGDYNSVSKVYYMCKPSENTVYTVSSPNVTVFNYTPEDFIEEEEVESTEETAAEVVEK